MRRDIAMLVIGVALLAALTGCETTPVQQGALMGGALGAGAGAIIGNQVHGQAGSGALIGGAAGALTGALVGDHVEKSRERAAAQPPAQQVVIQQAPPPPPKVTVIQTAPPPPPTEVRVVQEPPPPPKVETGHYENRVVKSPSGETYEERVWVPNR